MPQESGGWGPSISFCPADVAWGISFFFVIISLIIILVSYLRARKKEKQVVGR